MTPLVLGVDTSNYTTSVCAVSVTGELVAEARRLLPVPSGQRGLRQSDALFLHVQQLPMVMAELRQQLGAVTAAPTPWVAAGVSVRPRPWASSYMPVFHAGERFVMTWAQTLGVPVVRTSHQEGHLAAAEAFLPHAGADPFLAVHISGGTSDVVVARPARWGYRIEMVGEGADLHAGQFVDRVGVAMGLPFPAGPSLEVLAASAQRRDLRLPGAVRGAAMSFSGPCTAALRALERGEEPAEIAYAVQACIANSLAKAIAHASALHPEAGRVVIAGGVASNQWIAARVRHRLRQVCPRLEVAFAPARYASDNALGVARIAARGWAAEVV